MNKKIYFSLIGLCLLCLVSCNKNNNNNSVPEQLAPIELEFTSASVTAINTYDYRISFKGNNCSASFSYSGEATGAYSYDKDPSMMFFWHSGSYSCNDGSGSLVSGDIQISKRGANFWCRDANGREVSGNFSGSVSLPGGGGPVK
jgi:hypothetical protein